MQVRSTSLRGWFRLKYAAINPPESRSLMIEHTVEMATTFPEQHRQDHLQAAALGDQIRDAYVCGFREARDRAAEIMDTANPAASSGVLADSIRALEPRDTPNRQEEGHD